MAGGERTEEFSLETEQRSPAFQVPKAPPSSALDCVYQWLVVTVASHLFLLTGHFSALFLVSFSVCVCV